MTDNIVRNISDTARWVAVYRAQENDREDALFRDPFARRLAGERGEQIAESMRDGDRNGPDWSWTMRTYLMDRFIAAGIREGVDLVINLAAGLDARPYRMDLPESLTWIEVDLPEILTYKEQILAAERPVCQLERVRLDLSKTNGRREVFEEWGARAKKALILTEGLLIYLTAEEVAALGRDLAGPPSFRHWIIDLVSPGLLRMLQKNWGKKLADAGAPLKFGPPEGPEFFAGCGWTPREVHSMLHAAARAKRLPFLLRLAALFPESNGRQSGRPWGGICLLARS
ncbi:MAG TPA: SAM-dependent methyltransferase [Thermoanaerobaculia bacterium]|nr:SAM-dependent methyltransferase [Thermoanaerobaculia bacterium]